MNNQIAVIGECMIEVKPNANIGYGGDTLNFSIYLARLGVGVSYVTALGDDPMSNWMIKEWREEGVDCNLVVQQANAVPGLYLIDVDDAGERSFYYWRDRSPASKLFDDDLRSAQLFEVLAHYKHLYLSGITLAIYSATSRQRLFDFIDTYRDQGGRVLFDNNYRPRQWRDQDEAKLAFETMYRRTDVALPTLEDEQLLYGDDSEADIIQRIQSWGVEEVVLKKGAKGCTVAHDGSIKNYSAVPVEVVVDTTAAGDSFNAGFAASRLTGKTQAEAAALGSALAAEVVQHRGAIIDKELMAALP